MKNTEIKLVQSPVIEHRIKEAGAQVDARIAELNIENQIATVDTVKSLKDLRAELNKELASFEEQRKTIKKAVSSPYDEFEVLYKTEIWVKYNNAVNLLKDKIAVVENQIKAEKEASIRRYFTELCTAESIDFVNFEQLGIEINLSTSEKKYKEQINDFITKVQDDVKLIKTVEFEAETMAEYKTTLNASKAITTVNERKEKEHQEQVRIKATETSRRVNLCKSLGMVYLDITNSYEFDSDIFVTMGEIENLSKDEFSALIAGKEQLIMEVKQALLLKKQEEEETTRNTVNGEEPAPASAPEPKSEPAPALPAPTIETKEEIVKASFEVTGTMSQLRALGVYMRTNGISYKNIQK